MNDNGEENIGYIPPHRYTNHLERMKASNLTREEIIRSLKNLRQGHIFLYPDKPDIVGTDEHLQSLSKQDLEKLHARVSSTID